MRSSFLQLLLFPSLDLSGNLVDVLAVPLAVVNLKCEKGNDLKIAMLHDIASELATFSLEEDEGIVLAFYGNSREEDDDVSVIWRDVDAGHCDEWIGVRFLTNKTRDELAYE